MSAGLLLVSVVGELAVNPRHTTRSSSNKCPRRKEKRNGEAEKIGYLDGVPQLRVIFKRVEARSRQLERDSAHSSDSSACVPQ